MKKPAFTLIELLVVIVIIGILATIGIAQFNDYQEKARFAKAQAFASQADTVLMAETAITGYGFPLRLDFEEGAGTTSADTSGSGNDTANWASQSANISWITDTPDNSSSALNISGAQFQTSTISNMPDQEIAFSAFVRLRQYPTGLSTLPLFIAANSGFSIKPDGTANFFINGGGTANETNSNVGTIKLDRWYHLLGSYKDGSVRFFVDGDLVNQSDITLIHPFNQTNTGIPVGGVYLGLSASGREFYGDIDRVRIYPVGLDSSNL